MDAAYLRSRWRTRRRCRGDCTTSLYALFSRVDRQVLLDYGAAVDVAERSGHTALHEASGNGHVMTVEVNSCRISFPDISVSDASGSRGLEDSEGTERKDATGSHLSLDTLLRRRDSGSPATPVETLIAFFLLSLSTISCSVLCPSV